MKEGKADVDADGDTDKLDNSNVDNEDSLNLTIGEDEAKIFQDEVFHTTSYIPATSLTIFPFSFQESDDKIKEDSSK